MRIKALLAGLMLGITMMSMAGCITSENKSFVPSTEEGSSVLKEVGKKMNDVKLSRKDVGDIASVVGDTMKTVQSVLEDDQDIKEPNKSKVGEMKKR